MDEAAFIETIRRHPHDDTPRLIYADWLEERGDPRAEYLRLNMRIVRLQRDRDLSFELKRRLTALALDRNPSEDRYPSLNARLDELEQLREATRACDAEMARLAATIDAVWRNEVGIKNDFVIASIASGCKARVIQAIRGFTGLSLAKSKTLIKTIPCCVPVGLLREDAESARALFQYGRWPNMEGPLHEAVGDTLCEVAIRVRS